MYKLVLIVLLGLTFGLRVKAQKVDDSIVLYCDDVPYLMPEIENTINGLKKNKNQHLYFNKITNLTRLRENLFDDLTMDEFVSSQVDKATVDDPRYLEIRNAIINQFNEHDLFLKINIHKLGELLEFQFILYETITYKEAIDSNPNYIFRLTRNLENPKANYSVFINPKESNYLSSLKEAIKKIFPETNIRPVGILNAGKEKVYVETQDQNIASLRWDVNDTLRFSGLESFDVDSPLSFLKYEWSLFNDVSLGADSSTISFKKDNKRVIASEAKAEIVFDSTGFYVLELTVSDGIANSIPQRLLVIVTEAPLLYFRTTYSSEFYLQKSFIGEFKYNNRVIFEDDLELKYSYLTERNDHWKLIVRRESPANPNEEQKKVWDLYEKEKNDLLLDEKYAKVLNIKSISRDSIAIKAKVHFDPFDANRSYSKYLFSTQLDIHGVKSNKDYFEYDFTSSGLFRANYDFFFLVGNFDDRYFLTSDSVNIPTDGLISDPRSAMIQNNITLGVYVHQRFSFHVGFPVYSSPFYINNPIDLNTQNGGRINNLPSFDKYRLRFILGTKFHLAQGPRGGGAIIYQANWYNREGIDLLDYHYNLISALLRPDDQIVEKLEDVNCVCGNTNMLTQHMFGLSVNHRISKNPLMNMNYGLFLGFLKANRESRLNYSFGLNVGLKISIFDE